MLQLPPARRMAHVKVQGLVSEATHVLAAALTFNMKGSLAAAPVGAENVPLAKGTMTAYDEVSVASRASSLTVPDTSADATMALLGSSPYAKRLWAGAWRCAR